MYQPLLQEDKVMLHEPKFPVVRMRVSRKAFELKFRRAAYTWRMAVDTEAKWKAAEDEYSKNRLLEEAQEEYQMAFDAIAQLIAWNIDVQYHGAFDGYDLALRGKLFGSPEDARKDENRQLSFQIYVESLSNMVRRKDEVAATKYIEFIYTHLFGYDTNADYFAAEGLDPADFL